MKKMNKDQVDKKFFLLGLLIASGLAFSQITYQPSDKPRVELSNNQEFSDEGIKEVVCGPEDDEELAQLLENKVEEVNCIFGGCNSFF